MAIERLFRDIKSGGWDFGRSRLRVLERIERLWWVLALALVWAVGVGVGGRSAVGEGAWVCASGELGVVGVAGMAL